MHTRPIRVWCANACVLPKGLGFSKEGDDRKEERLSALLKKCSEFDVVLMQEVWACAWGGQEGFYRQCTNEGWNTRYTPVNCLTNCGNLILSKHPIVESSSHTFQTSAGWQRCMSNGVLHASVSIQNDIVHFFTTHLQSDTVPYVSALNQNAREVRRGQLLELRDFVRSTCSVKALSFVAGDFNICGGGEEYDEACNVLGLRSALETIDFPPTYNAKSFLAPPGWRTQPERACLDHVFTNLTVEGMTVDTSEDMSDHYPIETICSLTLKTELVLDPAHQQPDRS